MWSGADADRGSERIDAVEGELVTVHAAVSSTGRRVGWRAPRLGREELYYRCEQQQGDSSLVMVERKTTKPASEILIRRSSRSRPTTLKPNRLRRSWRRFAPAHDMAAAPAAASQIPQLIDRQDQRSARPQVIVFALIGPGTRAQRLLNRTRRVNPGCRGRTKPTACGFDAHHETGN